MSIIVSDSGNFESLQEGTYQAICVGVFDLGLQEKKWNGEVKQDHQVLILWEVDKRLTKGEFAGKRFLISKRYTKSLGEKSNLRKDLTSWRGKKFTEDELKAFDLEKIVGVNCLLTIIKNDKYTNVGVVSKLMENQQPIAKELEVIPEWIKKLQDKGLANYNKQEIEDVYKGEELTDEEVAKIPF
jgi:hypothetical protein